MIVLDASVLIGFLDSQDKHHAAAESLLARVDDELAANPLTLAEVFVAPARENRIAAVLAALEALEIDELPFPRDTALRLAQLRAATGLKMPDCCVLLAAEDTAATVASFDERLLRAAENRNVAVLRG